MMLKTLQTQKDIRIIQRRNVIGSFGVTCRYRRRRRPAPAGLEVDTVPLSD